MLKKLQAGRSTNPHTRGLRLFALAWVVLMLVVTTAGAAHIHGEVLPHFAAHVSTQADSSDLPGGEEHCPLCVAMHSALPTTVHFVPVTTSLVQTILPTTIDRLPDTVWEFAQFSRPPPSRNS